MSKGGNSRLLHDAFRVGIALKGIDGLLEIIGGIMLFFARPGTINSIVLILTGHELSGDPDDLIANFLRRSAAHLSSGSLHFGSLYLLSHGIVKVILVGGLWKGRLRAYPAAILFFLMFTAYQLYRFSYSRSVWMIILSVLDSLVVILTWLEYRRLRQRQASGRHHGFTME